MPPQLLDPTLKKLVVRMRDEHPGLRLIVIYLQFSGICCAPRGEAAFRETG
jgi:hypothetical protein